MREAAKLDIQAKKAKRQGQEDVAIAAWEQSKETKKEVSYFVELLLSFQANVSLFVGICVEKLCHKS